MWFIIKWQGIVLFGDGGITPPPWQKLRNHALHVVMKCHLSYEFFFKIHRFINQTACSNKLNNGRFENLSVHAVCFMRPCFSNMRIQYSYLLDRNDLWYEHFFPASVMCDRIFWVRSYIVLTEEHWYSLYDVTKEFLVLFIRFIFMCANGCYLLRIRVFSVKEWGRTLCGSNPLL